MRKPAPAEASDNLARSLTPSDSSRSAESAFSRPNRGSISGSRSSLPLMSVNCLRGGLDVSRRRGTGCIGLSQPVRDSLDVGDRFVVECRQLVAIDIDLRVNDVARANQYDQLGLGFAAARQVVRVLADVGNVHVAALGHRRPANTLADANEAVLGGGPYEGPQAQHVVREKLVDSRPVEAWIELMHATHCGFKQQFELAPFQGAQFFE